MDTASPSTTQNKKNRFTRAEVLRMLAEAQDQTNRVTEVTEKLFSDMLPDDKDTELCLDQLDRASEKLRKKVTHLVNDIKARKFRWKPEVLDEDWISASQFSGFQDSQDMFEQVTS